MRYLLFCLCFVISLSLSSQSGYQAFAEEVAEYHLDNLDENRVKWKRNVTSPQGHYTPRSSEIYLAALCANLYLITEKEEWLRHVEDLLSSYGDYHLNFDPAGNTVAEYDNGIPVLPSYFPFPKYVFAWTVLDLFGDPNSENRKKIESNIAEGANFIVRTQEWGPQNRAALRAEGLLGAASVLHKHPAADRWFETGMDIAKDNFGNWSVEDASMYRIIWLYSLCGLITDVYGETDQLYTPKFHYYFESILQEFSPASLVPDYGDAQWAERWYLYLPVMHLAASVFGNREWEWLAESAFQKNHDPSSKNIQTALALAEAERWGFKRPAPLPPVNGSTEVLDDQVGKKIVFRDGWEPGSTYLMLNYRDEGDGGKLYRNYLRNNLTVETEKMHHGHADENSIVLLMSDGAVLLHDGGYRDYPPSGPFGAYRSDFFHNKLIMRPGKAGKKDSSILEFLSYDGTYIPVSTQKLEFATSEYFDISRTREINTTAGYEADRIIHYLKSQKIFVVIDLVKVTKPGAYTAAQLWYGEKLSLRKDGFTIYYDSLEGTSVSGDAQLAVIPISPHQTGVEKIRRYWRNEFVGWQAKSGKYRIGEYLVCASILYPKTQTEPEIQDLHMTIEDNSVYISFSLDGIIYLNGGKLDLEREHVRKGVRPRHSWETAAVKYARFRSDAHSFVAIITAESTAWTGWGLTRVDFEGKTIFAVEPVNYPYNADGSPDQPGYGKLRSKSGLF